MRLVGTTNVIVDPFCCDVVHGRLMQFHEGVLTYVSIRFGELALLRRLKYPHAHGTCTSRNVLIDII